MISVVIPAYNEALGLGQTLASLTAQDFPDAFEVIVVDNNSTDDTAAVAQGYQDQLNLKVIHEPRQGRGAARAAGFAAAAGDIICSTDADTILPPNWLAEVTRSLNQPGVVAVSGTCRINEGLAWQIKFFNWFQPVFSRVFQMLHGYVWLAGFGAAVKKEAYAKTKGFRRDLQALEDLEIARQLSQHGRILLLTSAPVVTSARRFTKNLFSGLWSYVPPYVDLYILRKEQTYLKDIRN